MRFLFRRNSGQRGERGGTQRYPVLLSSGQLPPSSSGAQDTTISSANTKPASAARTRSAGRSVRFLYVMVSDATR